jgi:protease-4
VVFIFVTLVLALIPSCSIPTIPGRIALVRIDGIIMSGSSTDSMFFSAGTTSDHIVEVVNQAIDDPGIEAMVVRINSPGGSAAASQEIYDAFERFTETGRPLIASMADIAASGGYYVAAPADEIFANPATLTGSIGVVMQIMNYEGLYEMVGLTDETLTAGEFKDIGSATRPMTDEERAMLQGMIDEVHQQFKDAVVEGRDTITEENIDEIANGMIYNGSDAIDNGLVDKLGGMQDALDYAADQAGLGDNYVVDELGKVGLFDQFLEDMGAVQAPRGVAGDLAGALNPLRAGQNPFYRLWSIILLDPRFVGDNTGIQY